MLIRRIKKFIRQTKLGDLYVRSCGDWRYPFMSAAWRLADILVPRRTVRVDGISFTLSVVNWVTHFRWYLFKKKESEIRYFIDKYVRDGDVFFDIGANVGVFSIYCAKRYSNVSVYSFEPEYSNLNHLKDNVIRNGLAEKISIHSIAIGDFNGLSFLNMQDVTSGAAAHTESKTPIKQTEEGFPVIFREGISVVTLDHFCRQLGVIPHAMKIDTDGNEVNVLKGALSVLSDKRLRCVALERSPDNKKSHACCEVLESFDFKLVWSEDKKTRNQIWEREALSKNL